MDVRISLSMGCVPGIICLNACCTLQHPTTRTRRTNLFKIPPEDPSIAQGLAYFALCFYYPEPELSATDSVMLLHARSLVPSFLCHRLFRTTMQSRQGWWGQPNWLEYSWSQAKG